MNRKDLPAPQHIAPRDPEQDPKGAVGDRVPDRLSPRLDEATMRRFIGQCERLGIRRPNTAAGVVLTVFALSDDLPELFRQRLHLVVLDPPAEDEPAVASPTAGR